jgi:holo-[acyl-carrier protein] synthase
MLEPDRLQQRLDRHPELRVELFTEDELSYCDAQAFPAQHLAARFCAKEAVIKALGMDGFDPRDVEILDGGPPRVHLRGDVLLRATELDVELSISLTHLRSMAAAVALALPRSPSSHGVESS